MLTSPGRPALPRSAPADLDILWYTFQAYNDEVRWKSYSMLTRSPSRMLSPPAVLAYGRARAAVTAALATSQQLITTGDDGMGSTLTICRTIIYSLGGRLCVPSNQRQTATLGIALPDTRIQVP